MSATPDGGPAPERSCAAAITAAFKSASGFSIAIKQEQERLVYLAGWMETSLKSSSGTYAYMYRSGLKLLLEALRDAPVKHLFTPATVGVPTELVGPSRGGIFEMYEADVRQTHGERAFVLPFSLFSDGTTLPNSKAASAHPLRISAEFLPADQPREWHSLGAIPHVLALLGRGGSERAREARRELLQRALFITLDDIFKASHDGVLVDLGGDLGVWRAFPRQVCYSADYPEKRALLCLRGIGLCGGGPAIYGSLPATLTTASARAELFGRRSSVSTAFPGAFVLPGTLQSSYTGAQLRSAATMYALMVDGLFGPANWEAVKAQARSDISRRRSTRLRQDGGTVAFSAPAASAPGGAAGLPAPGTYNWEPFFQRFGDMTPQDAMTSVMAAFGRLVSDFYGYNQPSTAPTRAERAARGGGARCTGDACRAT
ncbi:hypothetical protein I4F81_005815 [Pyropia yezoensis]|uniref:Uncharacterized protein n=1 Tax=Pyropia yezoensis TaxID=2788 RepID=A0ACC3BZE5_PYRYE|nr:hypothetical protein I4F81_005815 [Neopyropia yezoensis]